MSESSVKPSAGRLPAMQPGSLQVPPHVTVLSGGVGGARFLQGLLRLVERTGSSTRVSVVTNTADDIWVRTRWVAMSRSPRPNQLGSTPYAASSSLAFQVSR